ncbi:MAG: hypothetical protein EPO21_11525 [Chloroflexota bacterium]|nr:MAG: hypothetical protein EPO21_11525 [Chloroflexota bacterium]
MNKRTLTTLAILLFSFALLLMPRGATPISAVAPPPSVDLLGQIGGGAVAFALQGNYAYVGVGPRLVTVDITDPAHMTVIGQSDVQSSYIRGVAVSGNYAYAASGTRLNVFDISNASHPTAVAVWVRPTNTPGLAAGITVVGSYAYLADGASGLRIIDISDPLNPSQAGHYVTPGGQGGGQAVKVVGSLAYVADGPGGLQIIDVSNPSAPTWVGSFANYAEPAPSTLTGKALGVFVNNGLAYVGDDLGLLIVDVSTPSSPSFVSFISTEQCGQHGVGPGATDVFVVGGRAYVANQGTWGDVQSGLYVHSGLYIVDVSAPATPQFVAQWGTDVRDTGTAHGIAVSGGHAFVAFNAGLFRAVDVVNLQPSHYAACPPGTPNLLQAGDYVPKIGSLNGVVVENGYAYGASPWNGLRVMDVSNPASPSWVSTFVMRQAFGIAKKGADVYIAGNAWHPDSFADGPGLWILDVANPANPTVRSSLLTPGTPNGIALSGSYAYLAEAAYVDTGTGTTRGVSGLRIVDISSPANPTQVVLVATPGSPKAVAVVGNYAYVAAGTAGLQIVDATVPASASLVASYPLAGGANAVDVAVVGSRAYVAGGSNLHVIDVSNPQSPSLVRALPVRNNALAVSVVDDYAYVVDGTSGPSNSRVSVFDLLSSNTTPVVSWFGAGTGADVVVTGGLTYVPGNSSGLYIVRFNLPVRNQPPTAQAGTYSVPEAGSVQLAGTGTDPDNDPLTFAWDLDNDGTFETSAQNVTFSAANLDGPASRTVVLQVCDGKGACTTSNGVVNVTNVPPMATLSNNGPVDAGSPATISFSNPSDPSGVDIAAGFHYAFACDGGSLDTARYATSGAWTSTQCTYASVPSDHTVRGRIIDKDDGFAEYTTVVHVNNAPAPAPTVNYINQIGGAALAVAIQGNHAYVGVGPRLHVVDISAPANMTVVGISQVLPAVIRGVAVSGDGNRAYLAAGQRGLYVFDTSNRAQPVLMGNWDSPGWATGIAVSGSYAFVADASSGLRIVNVADPYQPGEVGFYDTPGNANAVKVVGNYAYVADGSGGLQIIDVSNPSAAAWVASFANYAEPAPSTLTGQALGIFVDGGKAYVADDLGLLIVDVSNPAGPSFLSFQSTELCGQHGLKPAATDVFVMGTRAYVANSSGWTGVPGGFYIMDVTTPTSPQLVAQWGGNLPGRGSTDAIAVAGDYAFTANTDGLFRAVDIVNLQPADNWMCPWGLPNLLQMGDYVPKVGIFRAVVVENGYAYGASTNKGLRIMNVSNPADLFWVSTFEMRQANGIAKKGSDVYIAGSKNYQNGDLVDYMPGLWILDVSNPASPTYKSGLQTPGTPNGIAIAGNYAYLAESTYQDLLGARGTAGLRVVDITQPLNPVDAGFVSTPGAYPNAVKVVGNYAYIAAGSGGLQIVDITNPLAAILVSSFPVPGQATDVTVVGSYAYIAAGSAGLQIVDVSNPQQPAIARAIPTSAPAMAVAVSNNLAYVTDGASRSENAGLRMFDLSSPSTSPVVSYELGVGSNDIVVTDGKAYLVGFGGLYVFSTSGGNQPPSAQAGTYSVPESGSVQLVGTGSAPNNSPLSFSWDLNNDGTFETSGQSVTFSAAGLDGSSSQIVTLQVCDGRGACATSEGVISVTNVAPTATLSNDGPINEGGVANIIFSNQFDPGRTDTTTGLHFAVSCYGVFTTTVTYAGSGASPSIPCSFRNGTQNRTVYGRIIDKDDGYTEYTTVVVVNNVAPTVTPPADQSSNEGSSVVFSLGSFADPGTVDYPWTVDVDWGDGSAHTAFTTSTQGPLGMQPHTFADNGVYLVTVKVTDKDGAPGAASFHVTVSNVAPTGTLSNNGPINEGSAATVGFTNQTDPSSVDLTAGLHYAFTCDGGSLAAATYASSNTSASTICPAVDNPGYTVRARIIDKDGGFSEYTGTVVVNNVRPTIGVISGPVAPLQVNTIVTTTASFTDPGILDNHTAVWDWNDGQTSTGAVTEIKGSGSVLGSHTYTAAGVYTVRLTLTDKDGSSDQAVYQSYVVIYDPGAGFVTGGGWINSPAGAYALDASLTGRANFGFNSKYLPGRTAPSGQTEFQFKTANLNFHSEDYEWLVVSGRKGQYRGTGTVSGQGSYGFLLTVIDGDLSGGDGIDRFRIKIWDKNKGNGLVYDNQSGADDTADPTTALAGGSIVIHK